MAPYLVGMTCDTGRIAALRIPSRSSLAGPTRRSRVVSAPIVHGPSSLSGDAVNALRQRCQQALGQPGSLCGSCRGRRWDIPSERLRPPCARLGPRAVAGGFVQTVWPPAAVRPTGRSRRASDPHPVPSVAGPHGCEPAEPTSSNLAVSDTGHRSPAPPAEYLGCHATLARVVARLLGGQLCVDATCRLSRRLFLAPGGLTHIL